MVQALLKHARYNRNDLDACEAVNPTAGIDEVRELTDMDVLGVPVFAAVENERAQRSLLLGKGCAALMPRSGLIWRRWSFSSRNLGWAVFQPNGDLLRT
jgi:hypothetical protein